MSSLATILGITKSAGVAGQVQYTAKVRYPDEQPITISFVGSSYGGPVVMVWGERQTFVADAERYGSFGEEWVRRFFEED